MKPGHRHRTTRRQWLAAGASLAALTGLGASQPAPARQRTSTSTSTPTPTSTPATRAPDSGSPPRFRAYWRCRYGELHVQVWAPAAADRRRVPLVCLHQNPRSSRDFQRLAPRLAADRVVCAIDTPGCGASDPPPRPASIGELAEALDEALQDPASAIAGQPLDLFGQHTGATIALEWARLRPARIRRLALLGIPFVEPSQREAWRLRFAQDRPWVADPGYVDAQWRRSLQSSAGLELGDEEQLARFADALRAAPRSAWAFDAVFRYPFETRLPQVPQPALVLVVDELIAANTRAAAAQLPAARISELPQLDGRALDAAPGTLAQALREFLDA